MNPANSNPQNTPNPEPQKQTSSGNTSVTPTGKETEAAIIPSTDKVSEVTSEIEISPEVKMAGVKKVGKEIIELPPDVTKLGVSAAGSALPITGVTTTPLVSLPISDEKVLSGLSDQVTSALRWLAVWCFKKLQKAHLTLRIIHGKIVRVSS